MSLLRALFVRLGLYPRAFEHRCTDCEARFDLLEHRLHRDLRRGCPICGGSLVGPAPGDPDYRDYVRALRGEDTGRFDDPYARHRDGDP
jgi:predicted  nucleic acid-binding Zn-ribbon protein